MAKRRSPKKGGRLGPSQYERWRELHRAVPPALFHYTTAQGVISMLKSGHVWATESRYMNDPREFVHGAELILSVLKRHQKADKRELFAQLREAVMLHVREKRENVRIFCASFCENGDLLSQWRGYGDGGGGYALGFRPELLFGRERTAREPFRVLRRVIYDTREQERLVEEWLEAGLTNPADTMGFWQFFSEAIVCFKDSAYAEEGEWRLIQFGRAWGPRKTLWLHPVSFRERKGKIIPYADLDLSRSTGDYAGKLPICEVVHGPTQDPERSGKALRLLAESCGYVPEQLTLRASKIPFTG